MSQPIALDVQGLHFSYGAKMALNDVGFVVRQGEFKVLLGPNGAGKTTIFSLITRLHGCQQGAIKIEGFDLEKATGKALSKMGVVFQLQTLDLDLTVRQNLLYHAALQGIPRSLALERITAELTRLDMLDRLHEVVRNLNGGHRRRVEIARALIHEPDLLLLDEPTVGLDVPARRSIVAHVHALCKNGKIAVMWTTHLIDEVYPDDSVIILHNGQVLADGPVGEVNKKAGSPNIQHTFDLLTRKQNTEEKKI